MKIKQLEQRIITLEYRQEKEDADYGSCLWARFMFNLDKYELNINSDVGNYSYKWCETPEHESFLHLMSRINDDYLLTKLCGNPREFDYEASKKSVINDYNYDEEIQQKVIEHFKDLEKLYETPTSAEEFVNGLLDRFIDWDEYDTYCSVIYDHSTWQKRIVKIFADYIQPYIRTELGGAL